MLGSSSNGADAAEKDKQRQRQEKLAAWKNKQGLAAPAVAPVQPKKEETAWCAAMPTASSGAASSSRASTVHMCRMPWEESLPAEAAPSPVKAEPDVKPAVQLPPSVLKPSVLPEPEPEVGL